MKLLCVLAFLRLAQFSIAQTSNTDYAFPTQEQIELVLTQADRAFVQYEQAIKLEAQGGTGLEQSSKTDQESLRKARQILDPLRKSSAAFNGPPGFLIVTGLDDASRNMALCMGQAGMQASVLGEAGNFSDAHRLLQIGQSCLDTSTLLYTVSESALDLYAHYLLAENAMSQDAAKALSKCTDIIQNGCKKK
jgi:hypothetical protein